MPKAKTQIVVGEYYVACVAVDHPERKENNSHVRVMRAIVEHDDPDMWLVESSFNNDQYEVAGSALTSETEALRKSRLETEQLWGTKWVKKGGSGPTSPPAAD
jgi:hypothetical protein